MTTAISVKALTARQRQVLRLVASGFTGEQIGRRLGVRPTTVTRHLTETYRVLGAQDRAHAVALGIHFGHITLAELAAIGAESMARGPAGASEGLSGLQGAREAADGAPDVREAARPSGGHVAAREEAAA
jgi:DNA-binding CsgD family transcriptional regulator